MKNIITLLSFTISGILSAQTGEVSAYYQGVNFNLNGLQLKQQLSNKISTTHRTGRILVYGDTWEALKITDANSSNTSQVVLLYGWENGSDNDYTNDLYRNNTFQDPGREGEYWNREHTFARSLGNPDLDSESGTDGKAPDADIHHVRASDKTKNGNRGNLKFVSGTGNSGSSNGGFYPGDQWKGDVARMMMYMYLRYGDRCLPTNVGVGSTANTPDAMIDLFLQWNVEDPVSQIEIQRNNYLGNKNNLYGQGNRNPFIDNPYLATKIWGGTPAEDTWGTLSTNNFEPIVYKVKVYPNPSDGSFVVQSSEDMQSIEIFSINGQLIKKIDSVNSNVFEVKNLQSGIYSISIKTENFKENRKLIIN